jgi:hypothetical protein
MASIKQSLLDTIINFIGKRKVSALEKAFKNNKEIMAAVKQMNDSYKKIDDRLTDYCKKNPDICKEAEETKQKYR